MTEAELWKCIQWMDKRKTKEEVASMGGQARHESSKAQSCAKQKSAEQTAQTLGISARKVEQARTVMDHGDNETKQAIEKGDMSFEEHEYQR